MALNEEQSIAFKEVIDFINNPNQQFMNISGGAGTGKTYFISQVADGILRHAKEGSPLHTVEITATTNKATAVIAAAMPHYGEEIKTVHSFMNLRVKENFSDGTVKIIPTNQWVVHSGILLIIDEGSMINKELFKYLLKGLDNTCKILFVGDKNQLSPVKEQISPIYQNNYPTSLLTIPVRNGAQQALVDLCEQMKETVLTGVFTPIVEVPGIIDQVDGATLQGILERTYTQEDPNRRLLCYTNRRVVEYNGYIRQLRNYVNAFEPGEIVSNNSAITLQNKSKLYTDQILRIVSTVPVATNNTIIAGIDIELMEIVLEDVVTQQKYFADVFTHPADRAEVLKYYSGKKQWDRFFKVKNAYPELRSISASTTHKAQGSTYDSVIVDLEDIGRCTDKAQTARMQYVALSRPRSHIMIRGKLPDRYFE